MHERLYTMHENRDRRFNDESFSEKSPLAPLFQSGERLSPTCKEIQRQRTGFPLEFTLMKMGARMTDCSYALIGKKNGSAIEL
jgi:hypothetical protein